MTGYDEELFNHEKENKRQVKWLRCPICGKDCDQLYPWTLTVCDKVFKKMLEIQTESSGRFQLDKREYVKFPLVFKSCDVTLRPIDGMANYVSTDSCRKCIELIGTRHKFDKSKNKRFATNAV